MTSSLWHRPLGLLFAVIVLLAAPIASAAFYPAISAPVTDYSKVLTPEAKAKLGQRVRDHQAAFRVQVAVLLTPTTGHDSIEDFAFHTAQNSHIGDAKADSGVLIVIDTAHHEQRIEVGKGLEGGLSDIKANQILAVAGADLHAEHYDVAVDKILTGVFAATAGESKAASDGSDATQWQTAQDAIADHPGGYPMPWSILLVLFAAMLVVTIVMQWMAFWWKGALVTLVIGAIAIPAAFFALPFWASFYGPWVVGALFGAVVGLLYREEKLTAVLLYASAVTGAVVPVLFYKSLSDWTPPWGAADVGTITAITIGSLLICTWVAAALFLLVLAILIWAPLNLFALLTPKEARHEPGALHVRANAWFGDRFEIVFGIFGLIAEVDKAGSKSTPQVIYRHSSGGGSSPEGSYRGGGGTFGGGGASSRY